MRVTVLTPSRNKMLLDGVETLRDVKRQVLAKTGIPVRQQLIYFRGKQLKSLRRPLAAYHVRDDSTLYLVKRLGICRCLACRNSRYIEREEAEEERQQLRQLLGYAPDDPSDAQLFDQGQDQVEFSREATSEAEDDGGSTADGGSTGTATWLVERESENQWRGSGVEDLPNEEENVVVEEGSDVDGVGGESETDLEEIAENQMIESAEEETNEDVEEGGDEEEAEEVEEETDEGGEEGIEETDEANQDGEQDEEAIEEVEEEDDVAGETEELNEEGEEVDAAEEELELSGEEADDEEEHEEIDLEERDDEDVEILEIENIEDEPLNDPDEDNAEDAAEEDNEEEDDEDATILYSLVTGSGEDDRRREELELTSGGTGEEDGEDGEEERRPAVPIFVRQPAFEEDGANSVGEEDPDITELDDLEESPPNTPGQPPAEDNIPERVEDLLRSMTQPNPDPEAEEDPHEEQYPEDDPLFDPPDEEDPLLEQREEEDAGYMSGDEMDNA